MRGFLRVNDMPSTPPTCRRVAIGSYVSERKLVDELVRVGLNDHLVRKALMYLTQSGDLQLVRERRMVHRLR